MGIELIPDIDWLAASAASDDSWLGPGPKLVNIRPWMDSLASKGDRILVGATYGAAEVALQHWDGGTQGLPTPRLNQYSMASRLPNS